MKNENSLIGDINEMELFLKTVIPELGDDEVLLLLLTARKKYNSTLARSYESIRHAVIKYNGMAYIKRKIIETALVYHDAMGWLFLDSNGTPIPKNAFALYIVLNPKSAVKAGNTFTKEFMDMLYLIYKGDKNVLRKTKQLQRKLFSAMHRANSRRLYFLVDMDSKNKEALNWMRDTLSPDVVWVSETRGGYHIIVKTNNRTGKLLFSDLKEKLNAMNIEIKKECMTPVVGTYQGGFLVHKVPI